jgi:hypothetical protein
MTATTPTLRAATTLGGALAIVHEGWMEQVTTFLTPALSDDADFWSRWAGARFLSDDFGRRFRLECALLDMLGSALPEEAARTLGSVRQALEDTAAALLSSGRRRATGFLTARLARRFIDQLALWCVEVELATDRIEMDDLPPDTNRLLTRLGVAQAPWS